MDNTLIPLGLVQEPRRQHIVLGVIQEIGQQRLPKQRVRIQPRVVKRARSRFERKKPEHWQVPALELDVTFQEIIAVVPCIQGLDNIPEMPLLNQVKEAPDISSGKDRKGSEKRKGPMRQSAPDREDPIEPQTVAPPSSSSGKRKDATTSQTKACKSPAGSLKTSRSP
jgi:hypothetical protein